jgi:TolB protein
VTNHGSAFFPSWAPSGTRIAYDATSLPQKGIWLVDPDGTNRKHLGLGRTPDWNVLGTRLVYEGPPGTANNNPQLWTADTSRTDSTQLTDNDFTDNRYPAWSPNGEWIAWVAFDGPSDPFCQLRVMRANGSETRSIAECDVTPFVSWSPDSNRLVFARRGQENEDYTALWIIRRDGSDLRQLTDPSRNTLN